MWNKLSLRTRLTLFSSMIIIIGVIILTIIFNLLVDKAIDEPFNKIKNDVLIYSASSTRSLEELFIISKHNLLIYSIIFMVIFIIIGIIISWTVSKRALKPVTQFSKMIEEIDEHRLTKPIELPKSKDEINQLTIAFNHLLNRLNSAFEAQKRFAQNVAHELKTPIASILTNIEVMELDEEPKMDDYKEVVEITKENIERMSKLVKDMLMLNVYSIEQYTRFKFSELDILNDGLSLELKKKNITMKMMGDTVLYGNKGLLERAFTNIISNAIRYNKDQGEITILCTEGRIEITDTGIGIPSHHLDKVFEPFYCVDPSRSRLLGGSGLGLAIVKQIFDQHNIKFEVHSEEHVGTNFSIKFKS